MLQINLNGVRWIDETKHLHGMTPFIADQPKEVSWSVQSRNVYADIANRTIDNPAFASKAHFYETWEEELKEECGYPNDPPAVIADTLTELAQKIGMPEDALKDTITRYNAFCAKGVDEDFGKEARFLVPVDLSGPFYAIRGQRFSEACMGGLMVDGQCRVLRNDDTPIPGLYGVGDATSAMHIKGRLAVISELTWGVASSYTSGENAVEYVGKRGGVR